MSGQRLDSEAIERVDYDDAAHVLTITFRGTGGYRYREVPRAIYDALVAAASAGAFFNTAIRDRYAFEPPRRRHRPD